MEANGNNRSLAVEIEHLSRLKATGAINDVEFEKLKGKILAVEKPPEIRPSSVERRTSKGKIAGAIGKGLSAIFLVWLVNAIWENSDARSAVMNILEEGLANPPTTAPSGDTQAPNLKVTLEMGQPRCMTAPGAYSQSDDGEVTGTPPSTSCAPPQRFLKITNTDAATVKLLRVVINHREGQKACNITPEPVAKTKAENEKQQSEDLAAAMVGMMTGVTTRAWLPAGPLVLGASWSYDGISQCGDVVLVDVLTDRGSAEYHFGS